MAEKRTSSLKELRELPDPELSERLSGLRQELWQTRLRVRQGALQQTHLMKATRRDIARIQTIVSERKRAAAAPGGKAAAR